MDQQTAASIIDAARSELKRWGGAEPSFTHAALVLASRWADEFSEVFGETGRDEVRTLLAAQRFSGSESELTALLADEPDRRAVLRVMQERLRSELEPGLSAARTGASPEAAPPEPAQSESEQSGSNDADPDQGPPESVRRLAQLVPPSTARRLREREAMDVATELVRRHPSIPVVVGDRGVGRTAMLGEVAALLAALPEPLAVWRLAPDTIVANPTASIRSVLGALTRQTVLALDDFDVLADLATDAPERALLELVHEARLHPHARVVLVLNRRYASRIPLLSQALADVLAPVQVGELPPDDVAAIARASAESLASSHGLRIDETTLSAALAPAVPSEGALHPGLAISRLDRACARARLVGADTVRVEHLGSPTSSAPIRAESHNLALTLSTRIKGQPEAIEKVAERLALTRAGLDLRPERPDGVFLFVGPTGVGKTELAREIAVHEFGGLDRLIRLDMSEYAHDWAISRIAGPAPGYVGSTEPESWLTTRVAAMPECVVLLDEIEKAHPRVWNTFLQVFDAGRLTDGRGVTAVFSKTVIIMTSNLGVREASSRSVGFGHSDARVSRDRLLSVVREQMAPELLNRLDEIIVFDALTPAAIHDIAAYEFTLAVSRLSAAGWSIDVGPGVVDWLAETGHDPAYGARHLQRNIEHELLSLLARASSRSLRVDVADGRLSVSAT